MNFTQIAGKATNGHRPRWIVAPNADGVLEKLKRCPRFTFVKIRSDLESIHKNKRPQHQSRLSELANSGTITVVTEWTHDKGWNRMEPVSSLTFERHTPQQVLREDALWLLNPETYGMIFEECNAAGETLYPDSEETKTPAPSGPPTPKRKR